MPVALAMSVAACAQDEQVPGKAGRPVAGSTEVEPDSEGLTVPQLQQRSIFAQSLLDSHNEARAEVGVAALKWSDALARDAAQYAQELARLNRIRHASEEERKGAGENLWIGSTGFYSTREMMNAFLLEKRQFRPGTFPDVSATGRWTDVGHYTQIIWKETEQVGCAVANNRQNDVLVCRYLPAGNFRGVTIP